MRTTCTTRSRASYHGVRAGQAGGHLACVMCVRARQAAAGVGSVHRGKARRRAHGLGVVHSDDFDVSVHRHNARKPRGRRGLDACATRWARRRRRQSPVLFRLSLFEIAKLQKLSTNLKISKNKSCRGAINLQLSQSATYVLMFGLAGKTRRRYRISRPRNTVRRNFNSIKWLCTQNWNVRQL
jgi:hypothetical protein